MTDRLTDEERAELRRYATTGALENWPPADECVLRLLDENDALRGEVAALTSRPSIRVMPAVIAPDAVWLEGFVVNGTTCTLDIGRVLLTTGLRVELAVNLGPLDPW